MPTVKRPATPAPKAPAVVLQEAAAFEKKAQEAFAAYGKDRKKLLEDARKKTETAFTGFTLSGLSSDQKDSPLYVAPGASPKDKQATLFSDKLRRLPAEDAKANRKLRLRLTEAQIRAIGLSIGSDGRVQGKAPLKSVMEELRSATGGGAALERLERSLTACSVGEEADRRMAGAEACAAAGTAGGAGETPSGGDTPSTNGHSPAEITTAGLLRDQLGRQMAHVTSPETELKYGVERDGKITAVLKPGAADVTSYHDFHELKIAFESLWTEALDTKVEALGKQFYEAIVRRAGWSLPATRVRDVQDMRNLLAAYRASAASGDGVPLPSGMYHLISNSELERCWPLLTDTQRSSLLGSLASYQSLASGLGVVFNQPERERIKTEAEVAFEAMARSVSEEKDALHKLMTDIDARLSERYRFDVFAPDSVNYGVLLTYRQAWEPQNYQVGDLVSTLPLAPKEVRRYTTKKVITKSRAQKELQDVQSASTSSASNTSRAEGEIVKRARNATSFSQTAEGTVSVGVFEGRFGTSFGVESEKESSDTKRNFREAVLNASQEYRRQYKTEVEVSSSEEDESTTFGEVTNPNDEITVTYLFYELERQYRVSERIHRLTPVIMVANEVPAPHEINESWLMAHAWILRRVILDDGFLPALDYVTTSLAGDELAVDVLRQNMERQASLVDELIKQSNQKTRIAEESFTQLKNLMTRPTAEISDLQQVALGFMMGPLGLLLGGGDDGGLQEKREEMAKMTLERSDKDAQQFSAKLSQEVGALKESVDRYVKELQAHFDRKTAVARLRMHVKDNILFYMQAIWDYEPTDHRLFRLYNKLVPWIEYQESSPATVTVEGGRSETPWLTPVPPPAGTGGMMFDIVLTIPAGPFVRVDKRLSDVADLDRPVGYKGNYTLYSVKEPNYLHWYMMQDYVDPDTGGLRDPDEFANLSTDQLVKEICCLKRRDPALFAAERENLLRMIRARLSSSRPESDLVIIPSGSLYIEALPGKHPILEDFKMVHRAVDVKKVQSEVRRAELENLRLAARLLEGEREDPDVDRRIIVEGSAPIINPSES